MFVITPLLSRHSMHSLHDLVKKKKKRREKNWSTHTHTKNQTHMYTHFLGYRIYGSQGAKQDLRVRGLRGSREK